MKNLIIILLMGTLAYLYSCEKTAPTQTMAVSIMVDKTDKMELAPEKEKIHELLLLDPKSQTQVETGVRLRVSEISSVDFNRVVDVEIPAVNFRKINIKARQKEIVAFYQKVDNALDAELINKEQRHSSIFVPIAREANRLSKMNQSTKKLIIYSDLMEHNEWLNIYSDYKMPDDVIIQKFKKQISLNDLTGLTIVLRYIPKNSEDNVRYRKLIAVYTKIFEERGAGVSFEF